MITKVALAERVQRMGRGLVVAGGGAPLCGYRMTGRGLDAGIWRKVRCGIFGKTRTVRSSRLPEREYAIITLLFLMKD